MHAHEQEDFCSTECKILVQKPLEELQYLQRQALPWLVRVVTMFESNLIGASDENACQGLTKAQEKWATRTNPAEHQEPSTLP
jgi:hypothetical protein